MIKLKFANKNRNNHYIPRIGATTCTFSTTGTSAAAE